MRSTTFVLLFGAALSSLPAVAGQPFPYTAYVTGNNVYVRSGPGRNYYPTDKLQQGDQVEVYRHDPGTWYAIRPPEGSFSWVSARYVEPIGDGLGRTQGGRTVVRVGSKFSNIRDVDQVRLDRDEVVEILDKHNAGGQTWYKIAPPSGEFRWMSGRYLNANPPDAGTGRHEPRAMDDAEFPVATERPTTDDRTAATADEQNVVDARETKEDAHLASDIDRPADANGADRPRQRPSKKSGDQPQGWGRRQDSTQSVQWKADRPPHASVRAKQARRDEPATRRDDPATKSADSAPVARPATPVAPPLSRQLPQIERQLSAIVVKEPIVWEFSEVKGAAEDLLAEADTVRQRDRVQRVLRKIARFEEIQARHRQLGTGRPEADRSDRSLHVARTATGRPASATQFDGIGTLRPVISRKQNAPRFALVDESGAVVSFVTPGPGVELQPYVGRKVGIRGNRGYIREYDRTHVMAQRITALKGSALR